jgi:hypothetical protein
MERSHAQGASQQQRSRSRGFNTDVEDTPAATLKRRRRSSPAVTQPARRRRVRSAASSRAPSPARTASPSPSPSPPPSILPETNVWVQVPSWDDVRRSGHLRSLQQALKDAGKIRLDLRGDLIRHINNIAKLLSQRDIVVEDVTRLLGQSLAVVRACWLLALWEAYMAALRR